MSTDVPKAPQQASLQLALGTASFAICFAAWGLISAFAPRFREAFHLTSTQTAFLVAVPVLLGSLLRIITGMLADRFGGRAIFALLLMVVAVPAYLVPMVVTYQGLLYVAFFLGMAGSSFAVGVGFVSRWFPAGKQGGALGVYGLGNIGQSAAVFLGPVLAVTVGWQNIFRGMTALLVIWGITFFLLARNSPKTVRPASLGEMLQLLSRERLSWVLSLFYFLTFGGFVAFSIYLPVLLKDQFGLKPADAGFRTAGFVVLATLARPLGGWLSDKIGGARVLQVVFLGIIPFALLMSWPSMLPFTVGALGCAFLLGNGNGAVFKLVPQYFPKEVGTVTGLVGAMGGLGGFFPPLLLGFFRDHLHMVWPGFALLAFLSAILWRTNAVIFLAKQETMDLTVSASLTRTADRVRAGVTATFFTGLLVASIVVGSRNLQNFDPALVIYTFATIFATWGAVYHYRVWLDKPPTRVYWERGWQLFREAGLFRGTLRLLRLTTTHLAAQTFTGLALTVSQSWLRGEFYSFLAILHAITVISALLYLPFGKFFHIFQRPAQLGVKFYQAAGETGEPALCKRCGQRFASLMQIQDLNRVLAQVGFDYRMEGTDAMWQELCPSCKRKSLSLAQLHLKEKSHG